MRRLPRLPVEIGGRGKLRARRVTVTVEHVPLGSVRRGVLDATIVGAAAIGLSAAFRNVLLPIVGSAHQYRGSGSLIGLVVVAGSGAFIVTLAIELLNAAYQKYSLT